MMPSMKKPSINVATIVITIQKPCEYILTLTFRNKSMTRHKRMTKFYCFSLFVIQREFRKTDEKNLKVALNPIT